MQTSGVPFSQQVDRRNLCAPASQRRPRGARPPRGTAAGRPWRWQAAVYDLPSPVQPPPGRFHLPGRAVAGSAAAVTRCARSRRPWARHARCAPHLDPTPPWLARWPHPSERRGARPAGQHPGRVLRLCPGQDIVYRRWGPSERPPWAAAREMEKVYPSALARANPDGGGRGRIHPAARQRLNWCA